jgi:guanylate kinase
MSREGILTVVCGPSGVGKGTIVTSILKKNRNIKLSISATTRGPRQGEADGREYFFKTEEEFKEMIHREEFIEWVEYCGNYYGTPKKHVEETIRAGYDILLEIDIEGASNIKNRFPDCVSVFILPPSFEDLKKRIEGRGTESSIGIDKRLNRARKELLLVDSCDYVIINDKIDKAVKELNCILSAEKMSYKRNKNILELIGIA